MFCETVCGPYYEIGQDLYHTKHVVQLLARYAFISIRKCNEISYLTLHLNVTQWFLAIFMEHRLNTAFSVDV